MMLDAAVDGHRNIALRLKWLDGVMKREAAAGGIWNGA